MIDNIKKTIEDMQVELRKHEEQVVTTKRLINQLCVYAKMEQMYPDSELEVSSGAVSVQRNSFFGRPLTGCVRDYLEMRKRSNLGAAPLNDIFEALKAGGYDLQTISAKGEADQKRGVAISLGKNTVTFIRLPTDDWGLLEWYPNIREKKKKGGGENGSGGANGKAEGDAEATGEPSGEPADAPGLSGEPAVASAADAPVIAAVAGKGASV